jgi:RimJ/RimL family protein N-acetyltransferase
MDGVYRRAPMDARMPLEDAWPIFALRIRTERLVLRLPDDHDLAALCGVARAGIHEPDEMPFKFPWSTIPSPRFEHNFVQHHWAARGGWTAEDWALHLMVELDGEPVGSQSVMAKRFPTLCTVQTGSWLGRPFHGLGYGKEMRAGVLGFAFDGLGARAATTEAFLDNGPSNGVTRSLGYEPNGIAELAPNGVPRTIQHFRMTEALWREQPRPRVTIEGLEGCLELFGAAPGQDATSPA